MNDALIISDIHLGSGVCESVKLNSFLELAYQKTNRIIINGDLFDNLDFRRLNKHHWNTLSLLRKMSKYLDIVWIRGNHDGESEIISHLIGVEFKDEYIFTSGDKKILCLHGDRFDDFIYKYPKTSKIADFIYRCIQRVDKRFLPSFIKQRSKIYLRCSENMMNSSRKYAMNSGCDGVCLGHTHNPVVDKNHSIWYANSGCWTEKNCSYLTVKNGQVELKFFT